TGVQTCALPIYVTVTSDCPDNMNVITNPGLSSQVLTNLIVNSVKHGFSEQDTGEISLSLRELTATSFELDYRDNGKGISKENLSKIFEPFFTTQRGSGGTGLGLNITYNIITNALKGSVVCESEPGQGVRFLIQFKVSDRIA
ncbi:sensor histidine kinase, partial [Marisediminitalea sp.]|uniref:sensor histidine kinase n=2 Tax=Marisediminitalea sp. TaxID=2662268 RepID=UPI0035594CEA